MLSLKHIFNAESGADFSDMVKRKRLIHDTTDRPMEGTYFDSTNYSDILRQRYENNKLKCRSQPILMCIQSPSAIRGNAENKNILCASQITTLTDGIEYEVQPVLKLANAIDPKIITSNKPFLVFGCVDVQNKPHNRIHLNMMIYSQWQIAESTFNHPPFLTPAQQRQDRHYLENSGQYRLTL